MFTVDELRRLPIFSDVADKELDYLANTSGDVRLLPGEYVMHEGETQRVLFVLVEGRVEATKFLDGAERVVGVREAGDVFGEVGTILGSPYLASFRAAQVSRAIRIESKEFHVVAAAAPKFFAKVVAAALDRVEGLQELAAAPPQPAVAVIAPQWDNAGHELREFLQRNSVEYDWITPEDPVLSSFSLDPAADQRYPIVRLQDGTLLVDPSAREVAKAVNLCVFPRGREYDVAIIGGGPAGLAAAVYGASEGLSTVLLEREAPGGQAGTSSRIENYLGFPFGVSGDELANRALQQARRLGAEIAVTRTVQRIDLESRTLHLDEGDTLHARTIILAMGVAWRQLDIPSLYRLRGKGVYYGTAPGEAKSVQGKDIYLVGGGNSAGQAAINFANHANSVTILVRGEALSKSMSYYLVEQLKTKSNVRVETYAQVVEAYGDRHLEALDVVNAQTEDKTKRRADALFILIGADAETGWLPSPIERNAQGYVITGPETLASGHWPASRDPYMLETTVPGIFAVGDVRAGSVKRVAASVGEGSMAIAFVHQYMAGVRQTPRVPVSPA